MSKPEPPRPAGPTPFICFNPQCGYFNRVFQVKGALPADVLKGTAALVCPHCKQTEPATAVLAVKCPHCPAMYAATFDMCPKCHKKRQ